MSEQLEKKIKQSINLIKSAANIAKEHGMPLEVCYSGGKDSDVLLQLVRMSGVEYRAIYRNTTLDPKGTIAHAQSNGVEIYNPKITFRKLIGKKGYPSRLSRHCCAVLKEYKILDYAVLGIRADESPARAKRYKEPEQCRVYSKKEKVRQYYPILTWTKDDVLEFITEYGIRLHHLYYTESGDIDIRRRLGCMCCPMTNIKHRQEEFKKNPKITLLYIRGGEEYLATHPNSKIAQYVKDGYEFFCFDVICERNYVRFKAMFGNDNLFGYGVDCKKYLEDNFNISSKS